MRVAVVWHVEWISFARVDHVPAAGEIVHAAEHWEEPGGGGAVAAVQLAKLAGACDFFTALGRDDLGSRAARELRELGATLHVVTRDARTRQAITFVDPSGERTITTLGDRLEPRADDDLPWEMLAATDAVYVCAADAAAFRKARLERTMVVTSRVAEQLAASGVRADAVVGSARDPSERYDAAALAERPGLVVLTEGANGGTFETAEGDRGRFPAAPLPGPLADAYGGGDSFAAGLTFAFGRGRSVAESLAVAARCGAACVAGTGPYEGQLTAVDL